MPKFKIQHITTYRYEVPVRDSASQIMLYPFDDERQEVMYHKLDVTGSPAIEIHTDIFNNKVGTFTHSQPHDELVISSILEVVTKPIVLPEEVNNPSEEWPFLGQLRYQFPFIEFMRPEVFDALPEFRKVTADIHDPQKSALNTAKLFCEYVFDHFTYTKGVTTVDTTLDEIWKLRSGVCQDFAHILLAMLRLTNIPARYVSGYICPNKNGMRGEGATHAWVEAYIPSFGWLGLDPTNNCLTNENHVRLAIGKNYYDCSPVRGTYRGTSGHTLHVGVAVGYESGERSPADRDELALKPIPAPQVNSYRKHQEIQQQQQQQ
jgi:transglutaminase-like putative cysteine protease